MTRLLKGKFRIDSVREQLEFHTLDGREFDVFTDKNPPIEEVLEATFKDGKLTSWKQDRTLSAAPSRPVVALFTVLRGDTEITEAHIDAIKRKAKTMQDEYRRMGLRDIIVKGHVINGYDGSRSLRGFQWNVITTYLRDTDPNINYTHYHGWGGFESGICGRAWVGGTQAWTYITCGIDTMIHEQGHNFGLSHAATPSREYGEGDVYMGSGRGRGDMNTPHLDELGFIEPEDIKTLQNGEAGIFYLTQGSKNTESIPPGADKMVKVIPSDDNSEHNVISVSYFKSQIRVHVPSSSVHRNFRKTVLLKRIMVGDFFEIDGITVRYIEERDGIGKVAIMNGNDNIVDSNEWPTFPIPDRNYPVTYQTSGLWRNPEWSAQGMHVRYLGPERNQMFVGWLSWSSRYYRQEWYWSVMDINNDNYASGKLRTGRDAEIVGDCDMFFYDNLNGTFRVFSESPLGSFVFPCSRLSNGVESDISGFYGIGDGNGLSLEVTDRDTIVGYLFTYNDRNPLGVAEPKWQLVLGNVGQPLTVYDVEGGVRGIKADFETIPTGILEILRVEENGNIAIELDGRENIGTPLA